MLVCNECGESAERSDEHQLCDDYAELTCPHCGATRSLSWVMPNIGRVRKINAAFDYYCQVYRDDSGRVVTNPAWVMSCPQCTGPAVGTHVDSYNEHYTCLECKHNYTVN